MSLKAKSIIRRSNFYFSYNYRTSNIVLPFEKSFDNVGDVVVFADIPRSAFQRFRDVCVAAKLQINFAARVFAGFADFVRDADYFARHSFDHPIFEKIFPTADAKIVRRFVKVIFDCVENPRN